MRLTNGRCRLSASDLANHLGCRHLTTLDLSALHGHVTPPTFKDPILEVLQQRGFQHESAYLDHLRSQGLTICTVTPDNPNTSTARPSRPPSAHATHDTHDTDDTRVTHVTHDTHAPTTLAAMQSGADIIVQPTLTNDHWHGRADFLLRVPTPSDLGAYSYEVIDTKLARDTRAGTMLQLCLYSDLVAQLQGLMPEHMHVVSPGTDFQPQTYRVHDYLAYYRLIQARLAATADNDPGAPSGTYPEPVSQCDICRWWSACTRRRREDDHLSLVAGISTSQRHQLADWNVETLADLAQLPIPLPARPTRGAADSYIRVREQARVQLEARDTGQPVHELLPVEPDRGLNRLPEPSPGDIFFDIEGDAFVGTSGLEYLLGWVTLPGCTTGADDDSDDSADSNNPAEPNDPVEPDKPPEYHTRWAITAAEEKAAFEAFIDYVMARWADHPDLHIYHFAPYEPSAVKRLMGRYATREDEIDRLLRAGLFVDLHSITRQAVRAGIERYSIKDLEQFYGFQRAADLRQSSQALRSFERLLELNQLDTLLQKLGQEEWTADVPSAFRNPQPKNPTDHLSPNPQPPPNQHHAPPTDPRPLIALYNRDDCLSTLHLRNWLETLRSDLVNSGKTLTRPTTDDGSPSDQISERQLRVQKLMAELLAGLPDAPEDRTQPESARWLLAHLLDWHRREEKAAHWENFRLQDLEPDELRDEKAGLAGLLPFATIGGTKACPIHRYHFPPQDVDLRKGDELKTPGGDSYGTVVDIDVRSSSIDIKKRRATATTHARAAYAYRLVPAPELAESLMRLGEWVAANDIDADGSDSPSSPDTPYRAARDLLMALPPRLRNTPNPSTQPSQPPPPPQRADYCGAAFQAAQPKALNNQNPTPPPRIQHPNEPSLTAARRLALALDGGILAIQGPPGSGKTYTGARMICELARAGLKIGVTATSHKVIRNLLDGAIEAADEEKLELRCIQKPKKPVNEEGQRIIEVGKAEQVAAALAEGSTSGIQVAGGTAWLWSRPEFFETVDVLFVDEAGQMSLANVLAVAQCARNVVLLGDPQQLEQPLQGSHPEGAEVSALEHLLGDHQTIPPHRGLFLAETWRLHPSICQLTSELFYEGRLAARPGLEIQELKGPTTFAGAGLWFAPVEHRGNQNRSNEEVERVAGIYRSLLLGGVTWIDREGDEALLTSDDILIVAPYNAQVAALGEALPEARIGTVDKFQGQEAPVVIYSMATSSPEEAPRGMEFLFSLNRLNVATSRAKCVCVLVASPRLFEPECRTPRQMRLANGFCRYVEMAREV